MGKMLALLFIFLLTIGSVAGYIFLTEKINAGVLKIASGEGQLKQGEQMLARGKAKLAHGKRELSETKNVYNGIKTIPFVWIASKLPITGEVFTSANHEIAEGSQQVVKGVEKIKNGEKLLAAGRLELSRGVERLNQVNKIRIACAVSAIFFAALLMVLGFYWRRSLCDVCNMKKPRS